MMFYRTFLNTVFSFIRSFAGLLLGLFCTPIILKYIGAERFGAYRVMSDWIAHLGLLEFGLLASLLAIYAKIISKKGLHSIQNVTVMAYKKYSWVIGYQLFGFAILYFFRESLIPVSDSLKDEVSMAFLFAGVPILFQYSQVFRSYIEASQKGYLVDSIIIFQNAFFLALAVTFAIIGWGLTGQALAYAASIVVSFLLLLVTSHRMGLHKKSNEPPVQSSTIELLNEQRMPQFLVQVTGQISLFFDNILIGLLLGASYVTPFYLTQRLLLIGQQQLQSLGSATWPSMSELYHRGDFSTHSEKLITITELIAFFAGVFLSLLCFLNPGFVILWTGVDTFAGVGVNSVVILNVGIIGLLSFWNWCFSGAGLVRAILPMIVTQAVFNALLSLVFTYYLGLIGPVLGTLVSCSVVALWWENRLLHRHFKTPLIALTKAWLLPFVLPVSLSILIVVFFGYPVFDAWWELILTGSIVMPLIFLLFYFLLISKPTQTLVIEKIRYLKDRFS